jgi:hypothetical protein
MKIVNLTALLAPMAAFLMSACGAASEPAPDEAAQSSAPLVATGVISAGNANSNSTTVARPVQTIGDCDLNWSDCFGACDKKYPPDWVHTRDQCYASCTSVWENCTSTVQPAKL